MRRLIWDPLAFTFEERTAEGNTINIDGIEHVVSAKSNDIAELRDKIINMVRSSLPTNMYTMLTGDCNLDCDYCYIEKQRKSKREVANPGVVKQGISDYLKMIKRQGLKEGTGVRFLLFGGEPGLELRLVEETLRFIDSQRPNFPFNFRPHIFTNGLALTERLIDVFRETGTYVILSVDGPPEISSRTRREKDSGIKTLDRIDQRIAMLSKSGTTWEFDFVLTPLAIENIHECIDYAKRFNPFMVGSNTMTRFCGNYTRDLSIGISEYMDRILEVLPVLIAENIPAYQLQPQINAFMSRKPNTTYYCEIMGGKRFLAQDGLWLPCEAFLGNESRKMKSLEDYKPLIDAFLYKHPVFHDECQPCHSLGICGGGCTYLSLKERKGETGTDSGACYANKRLGKWLIEHRQEFWGKNDR
jgi:radical SAM protein with 4Fe4S-binding SPASM domain